MRKYLTALGVTVAAAVAIACGGGGSDSPGGSTPAGGGDDPKKDVKIAACKAADFNTLDITVTVKNSTDSQASYLITAEGLDASGNRLGEANGAANSIAKGGTATVKLIGNLDGKGTVKTCRVASVTRS